MFPDRLIRIKLAEDEEKALLLISRHDSDLAFEGYLDTERFSDYWQKIDFFRQCGKQGYKLKTNLRYYSNLALQNDDTEWIEPLLKDFVDWKIKTIPLHNHYLIYNDFKGWQREVVSWYNQKVSQGFNVNRKQLFILGNPGDKKSRFFKHLFAG